MSTKKIPTLTPIYDSVCRDLGDPFRAEINERSKRAVRRAQRRACLRRWGVRS